MRSTQNEALLLLRRKLTYHFGRASNDHGAVRKLFALSHQGACTDDATFTDFRAIEHDGANTDQRAITHGTTMQHDLVAHRDVVTNREWFAHVGMQHTGILDVAIAPNADTLRVSTNYRSKPHTGIFTQFDIANDLCTVGNPRIDP